MAFTLEIICAGGLGASQMGAIVAAFQTVGYDVDPGDAWDGYKTILGKVQNSPAGKIVVLGHSFAGIPILQSMLDPRIIFAGIIDPVSCKIGVDRYPMPPDPPPFIWYQREGFGVEVKLQIENAGAPRLWPGGHNELPSDPALIAELLESVVTAAKIR